MGASSYIKTEASAVTRVADNVSRVLGDEFNGGEFSLLMDLNASTNRMPSANADFYGSLNNGSYSNNISLVKLVGRTDLSVLCRVNNAATYSLDLNVSNGKIAFAYSVNTNNLRVFVNGQKVDDATPSAVLRSELITRLSIFTDGLSGIKSSGSIRKSCLYPKALSDQEAIELTKV